MTQYPYETLLDAIMEDGSIPNKIKIEVAEELLKSAEEFKQKIKDFEDKLLDFIIELRRHG